MILHEFVFDLTLYLSYILYIFAYLQVGFYNPKYLDVVQDIMRYYVTGFLLIRFNPFVKATFTEFDRRVVFSSALFLLATTAFNQYAKTFDLTELARILKVVR